MKGTRSPEGLPGGPGEMCQIVINKRDGSNYICRNPLALPGSKMFLSKTFSLNRQNQVVRMERK